MNIPLAEHRRLLGVYLRPSSPVAVLAALLLSGIALQLVNPQILRTFIDTAQAGGPVSALVLAATVYLIVGLLGAGWGSPPGTPA